MKEIVRVKREAEKLKKLYKTTLERLKYKKELYGPTPPSVFVGSYGYPKINLGSLVGLRDIKYPDDPYIWGLKNLSEDEIINYRLSLINARKRIYAYIGKKKDRFYEEVVESTLSIKPVYVEAKFKKILTPRSLFKPISPSVYLERYSITENPKIPLEIEKYIEDSVKASEAIISLYNKGYSEYYLSKLFSLGLFGNYPNRKLVPSKWAITAVQSILIENFSKTVKKYDHINKYILFHNYFHGNSFYILLLPGNLDFELLEAHQPFSVYNQKSSLLYGKDDESGGYFSAKLSFLEFLNKMKFKASCIVFRIVTREYRIPLGVWVVREGTRKAFFNKINEFDRFSDAVEYLKKVLEKEYNINIYKLLKYSKIFKSRRTQLSLLRFMKGYQNF